MAKTTRQDIELLRELQRRFVEMLRGIHVLKTEGEETLRRSLEELDIEVG